MESIANADDGEPQPLKTEKFNSGHTRSGPRLGAGPKQVALIIETSNAYARKLLHGIVRYVREHSPWSLFLIEQSRGEEPPAWVSGWKGDGIIARIENLPTARAVLASGLPAVNLSDGRFAPSLPWIETDDLEIARLAFAHLAERGFRRFAFCGDARFQWSLQRGAEFQRLAVAAGHTCHELPRTAQTRDVSSQIARLESWVENLPKPIGIFACYDIRGQQLLDACRNRRIAVPEQVAVLGVDDDDLLCELAFPPLSSVAPNAQLAGYTAAQLLDAMMDGVAQKPVEIRIKPLAITARQSTDILAVNDPWVARALRFIRDHASEPIRVDDLLHAVPLSRRVLERRFVQLVGHSPHAEILAVKLNRVRQLLLETELSIEEIAARTGFEHSEYLNVVFKRETGESPGRFRRHATGRSRGALAGSPPAISS